MKFLIIFIVLGISGCTSKFADVSEAHYQLAKPLINRILNEHKDKILTPSDIKSGLINNIPENYDYKMIEYHLPELIDTSKLLTYKFTKIDGEKYFFTTAVSNREGETKGVIFNNATYALIKDKYINLGAEGCYFVIGACEYSAPHGDKQLEANTTYENGLWITNYTLFGNPVIEYSIFDMYGLPLYKYIYRHGASKNNLVVSARLKVSS